MSRSQLYTLSLHDALPICSGCRSPCWSAACWCSYGSGSPRPRPRPRDPESTRPNSNHTRTSYNVTVYYKKWQTLRALPAMVQMLQCEESPIRHQLVEMLAG